LKCTISISTELDFVRNVNLSFTSLKFGDNPRDIISWKGGANRRLLLCGHVDVFVRVGGEFVDCWPFSDQVHQNMVSLRWPTQLLATETFFMRHSSSVLDSQLVRLSYRLQLYIFFVQLLLAWVASEAMRIRVFPY
jgi:hypothetical protein